VALNKPSAQISTYTDQYGQHRASLANDGSSLTDYTDTIYGCAASNPGENNPWWAVDLGAPTLICQVDFTNRRDDTGNNLITTVDYSIHIRHNRQLEMELSLFCR